MQLTAAELTLTVLAAGVAVDVLFGEPPGFAHPVVWMGAAIRRFRRWEPRSGSTRQLLYGAVMAVLVIGGFSGLGLVAAATTVVWPSLAVVILTWLFTSSLAIRELDRAGARVGNALATRNLSIARWNLRGLCAREPGQLGPGLVASAAVESLAENASDSIVAPLFYYALFGVPGALAYRAINTLDAVVGYRGELEYLGKAAARIDDVANLVPARITGVLLIVAGGFRRANVASGWRAMTSQARTTASPNAGYPMAAMAGLLGVELRKPGHYRLGAGGSPDHHTIDVARRLLATTAGLAVGLTALTLHAVSKL